jgi:hypothetical protein
VTLASPAPASNDVAVSAVSSEITVVSSTTVVSITAVDSLVNPAEVDAGAEVSGAGTDVSSVVVSGESSEEVAVSTGADEVASVVVVVVVSDVSGNVDAAVLDVSGGAEVTGSSSEVVGVDVVGFTGGGVGVVVPVDSSLADTIDASASPASASSQALVSFSQPTPNVSAPTQSITVATCSGAQPGAQPGLRRDLACRGSFVFVIVSRYLHCQPITTPRQPQT